MRLLAALFAVPALALLAWLALAARETPADFVVASDALRTIDPARVSFMDELQAAAALFEGLTRLNAETYHPEPALAERWDISDDGRAYTFHLREGLRWSNGEPLTAGDVRWSWMRVLDPACESQYASLLFVVDGAEAYYRSKSAGGTAAAPGAGAGDADVRVGVEAPDARTLRVRLASACPFFLELMAFPTFAPVHPPLLERLAYRDGRVLRSTQHLWTRPERIVTCGAFTLERWEFKRSLRLRRNPHYWDAAGVHVDSIELRLGGDANAGLVAYETGGVHLLRGLEAETARRIEAAQRGGRRRDLHLSDRFATFFLRVNCRREPLDDADFRKALSLAIDRESLCAHVLGLGETPARTFVPHAVLREAAPAGAPTYAPPRGLGTGLTYAESLALARLHLARAGFSRDAPPRALELAYAPEPAAHRRVIEAIQAMWQTGLGLRVELRPMESKVLSERIRRLDYDLVRSNWFGDYLDPAAFLEMFTSVGGQNRTGWGRDDYDALIAAAAGESEALRRLHLLRDAESILVEQELPILPIFFMRGNFLLSPGFAGLRDHPRGTLLIHRVRRAAVAAAPRGPIGPRPATPAGGRARDRRRRARSCRASRPATAR